MNRIRQWTIQRPRWAIVLAAGIILAALLALVSVAAPFVGAIFPECSGCQGFATHRGWRYIIFGLVSVAAVLVAAIPALAGKPLFRAQPKTALEFDGARQWMLVDAAARRPLRLIHAWPAFAWVRLRFCESRPAGSKETMLELTVWKSSVSPEAWRELRVQLALQAALPGWRADKGGR